MAKRILGFTPLFPHHIGGLENHAEQLNEQLARRGHIVLVWAPQVPKEGKLEEYSPAGVHILRYPAFEIITNYPVPNIFHPVFWRHWKVLWEGDWDVCISHTRFFFPSLIGLVFTRIRRLPLLHIEHGSDYVHLHNIFLRLTARIYDHILGRIVLRHADAVVAISQASARFVKQLSGRTVDAVIYRGIDVEKIAAIPPAERPSVPTITYVGRLIDGKGVHLMLSALAHLKHANWQAWVIGDGSQRGTLEEQAHRLGIAIHVTFFGALPWKDGISRMKASTIIVNPSYTEGLPTSVIEACVTSAYLVATDVGGTAEITGRTDKTCRLIPPGDVAALAEALQELISQDLPKHSDRAQRILARFTWPASIDLYEKLFKKVITSVQA